MRQRDLEIHLQRVDPHPHPTPRLEQYQTPARIAAAVLYIALGRGDIADRRVLDAGCGTGILAIGAKLLGAREVTGLDVDAAALDVAAQNARTLGVDLRLVRADIVDVAEPFDTVLQNPPFGAQRRHADEPFLVRALDVGRVVYSFHHANSADWVDRRVAALGGTVSDRWRFAFPIPHTFPFHRRRVVEQPVDLYRILPAGDNR